MARSTRRDELFSRCVATTRSATTPFIGWKRNWTGWKWRGGAAPIEAIRRGDVIGNPRGDKQSIGASGATAIARMAIQEEVDDEAVEWMEHVTDDQYPARWTNDVTVKRCVRRFP